MTTADPPMDEDDDAWAQVLAGETVPGARPETRIEAALLRQGLRQWIAQTKAAPDTLADDAGLQRLMIAARARGLTSPPTPQASALKLWCAGCAERARRWVSRPAAWGAVALAGVLGWAVLPGVLPPSQDEQVMRSNLGVLQMTSPQPRQARDALAAELTGAGADVRTYERLGRFGLDAEIPAVRGEPLRALLARRGLTLQADGSVRVEFNHGQAQQ